MAALLLIIPFICLGDALTNGLDVTVCVFDSLKETVTIDTKLFSRKKSMVIFYADIQNVHLGSFTYRAPSLQAWKATLTDTYPEY